jgi:hypothetical protein
MTRLLPTALLLILCACSSAPTYNPTVFPYEIDEERLAEDSIRSVVITHINLGGPSRRYLEEHQARIDRMVTDYLEENGFRVIPGRAFEQKWRTATRIYGDVWDPTTGSMNQKAFIQSMVAVRDELLGSEKPDAIVFTDLLEQEVPFSGGLQHLARWHGVSRKPTLQGPGDGVSADFDWSRPAKAASLWVNIYDMELQRVFTSIGGLDMVEAIDTRSSSGRFVRRRSILENSSYLREGIELAFHPFIVMEDYPGKPTE